ncbi:MAG: hypothetical protein E7445_06355 [Ruminococcaceae bacterium]|nr:hypothetical protein [Oscillospiraceae bacterium]
MEKDYIAILIDHLNEQRLSCAGTEYFLRQQQEHLAFEALAATLSPQQHKLLLSYEAEKNAAASVSEDLLARQVFLLAREIFR